MYITSEIREELYKTWQLLLSAKSIVLTSHIDPDGDAIGSCVGLYHLLRASGKDVCIIMHSPVPANLRFLIHTTEFYQASDTASKDKVSSADWFCILDLNHASRLGQSVQDVLTHFTGHTVLIDHHLEPSIIPDRLHSIVKACSTCEIVSEMAKSSKIIPSVESATALYTGIMTDTGGFRHPRTTSDIMRLAAWLIDCGANPVKIYDKVMNAETPHSIRLLGMALSSLQIHLDGNLVLIVLTKQQLENYLPEETEGFVNYTLSLAGVKIGALITEWPDKVKISLRSKPEYDVRSIAQKYGGGGHQQAAGARISHGDIQKIVYTIINDCEAYLHSIESH